MVRRLGKQSLGFDLDGVTRRPEMTRCVMTRTDYGDDVFRAKSGIPYAVYGMDWTIEAEAVQSTDHDSLWMFLYDHYGQTVPFVYAPWGNPEPSADEPHFVGELIVPPPPALGGPAARKGTNTFEVTFLIQDGPHKITEQIGA